MHPSIRHMKDLDFLELRNLKLLTKSLCSNAQLTVGRSIIIQSPFIIFWTIAACAIILPLMLSLDPVEHFLIKRGQAYIRGSKWIYAKYNWIMYVFPLWAYYWLQKVYVSAKGKWGQIPIVPIPSAEPVVRHLTEEMPHD